MSPGPAGASDALPDVPGAEADGLGPLQRPAGPRHSGGKDVMRRFGL